jgi:hypothetical protein
MLYAYIEASLISLIEGSSGLPHATFSMLAQVPYVGSDKKVGALQLS